MNSQFILGFIAGEGSFSAKTTVKESNRFGVQITPEFTLKVKERGILERVKEHVGVGYIRKTPDGYSSWRVSNREGFLELIEFIEENKSDAFVHTEKFQAYQRWKTVVEERKELLKTKSGVKELIERARDINRMGTRAPAHTKEELFEIVEQNGSYECGYELDGKECERTVSEPDTRCYLHEETS